MAEAQTRPALAELEDFFSKLINSDNQDYQALLRRLYGFWRPMEAQITDSGLLRELPYLRYLLRSDSLLMAMREQFGDDYDENAEDFADYSSIGSSRAGLYALTFVWASAIYCLQEISEKRRNQTADSMNEPRSSFFLPEDSLKDRHAIYHFYQWLDDNLRSESAEIAAVSAQQICLMINTWNRR